MIRDHAHSLILILLTTALPVIAQPRQQPGPAHQPPKAVNEKTAGINAEIERVSRELRAKLEENAWIEAGLASAEAQLAANTLRRGQGGPSQDSLRALELNERGLALYKEKKHAQALTALLQAVALRQNNVEYVNNKGFLYHRMADPEEALQWLRRSQEIDSSRAVTYLNLG
jgi:tetratricopeptide (TPR) repeat protein